MESLYEDDLEHLAHDTDNRPAFDDQAFLDAAGKVYQAGHFHASLLGTPEGRRLVAETFRLLSQAIGSGLPHEVPEVVRYALQENAFIFSGFKAYHTLREVGLSLLTDEGHIKPYGTFLHEVQAINRRYNHNYLYAEYNHAVGASLMAARWQQIEHDGDRYDLQYRTAEDERVRESHRLLHGTTLPPSDPFWSKYLPPNGWNCRCTAVQVRKGKYPQSDPALSMLRGDNCTENAKQQIFRFNPGRELKLFPPRHPYYPKGCGSCNANLKLAYNADSEKCQACGIIAKCLKEFNAPKFQVLGTYKNGAQVRVSSAVTDRESKDYKRIHSAATAFARQGRRCDILPRFDSPKNCHSYEQVYQGIHPDYYGKCPDLAIDGLFYEHEGYTTNDHKKAIKNMLKHGLEQSDRIIIEKVNLADRYIIERIKGKINEGCKVTEVWVHENGTVRLLYNNIGA